MATAYKHLDAGAAQLMQSSDLERIRYIQRDRFIEHSAVAAVLSMLDDFVGRPISVRPPCMALIGDAGAGKSTLLDEFMQRVDKHVDGAGTRRALYSVADAFPTLQVLQTALLAALSIPSPLTSYRERWAADDMIKRAISELGIRVVIIDEVQHILNLPRPVRPALWDWIKWISTACRVSVVCAGIPGAEEIVLRERQLQSRFAVVRLPRWVAGPAFAQFLSAFERSLPLRRPSGLGTQEIQKALLRESQVKQQVAGVTHGVKQIIESAAIHAIRTGEERITLPALAAWRHLCANSA